MSNSNSAQKPTIGLALGGGGVRGLAHIGVLNVLEREGVEIHSIAGTSMGGIIGALCAVGMAATEIEEEVRRLVKFGQMMRLVDWRPSPRGLMPGHNFYDYLANLLGKELTFDELQRPLAVTAVDLNSWREAPLTSGRVIDAVRASMSMPGVFAPVEIDDMRLIDGGFLNNVPVDLARQLGAQIVIAVDVDRQATHSGAQVQPEESPFPSFTPAFVLDLWLVSQIMVNAIKKHKFQAAHPEIHLTPPIPLPVGILSGLNQLDEIIKAGARAMEGALPQLWPLIEASKA